MLDRFQALIMADAMTARFLAFYIGVLVLLYLLNVAAAVAFPGIAGKRAGHGRAASKLQDLARALAVRFGNWVASLAITPNQITVVGLLLVCFVCALFLQHRNTFIFGSSLIIAYLFDTLDGVVARAQGRSTRFGGYLDAVVDRYQEVATYFVIGVVTQMWMATFLVMTGSILTSYNKARTALEVPIDNKGWPDLLEKQTRLFILCVALIGNNILPWLLPCTLWALAAMTHFTALQRIVRSYVLIRAAESATIRQADG